MGHMAAAQSIGLETRLEYGDMAGLSEKCMIRLVSDYSSSSRAMHHMKMIIVPSHLLSLSML